MSTQERTNQDRADGINDIITEGPFDSLVDLLADIFHYCDKYDVDYVDMFFDADKHYGEEIDMELKEKSDV